MAAFHFACYPQKLYPVIFQMLQNKLKYNLPLYSSIIIWTFQIFGLIGILFWNSQWFINATPLCLMIYFGLVISNGNSSSLSFISIAFLWGLLAEIIGVRTPIISASKPHRNAIDIKERLLLFPFEMTRPKYIIKHKGVALMNHWLFQNKMPINPKI